MNRIFPNGIEKKLYDRERTIWWDNNNKMWSDWLKRAMQKTQVKYFDIKAFLKTTETK